MIEKEKISSNVELFKKSGSVKERKILVNKIIKLIKPVLLNSIYKYPDYIKDDLIQDCYELLPKILNKFDSSRNISFLTFFTHSINLYLISRSNVYLNHGVIKPWDKENLNLSFHPIENEESLFISEDDTFKHLYNEAVNKKIIDRINDIFKSNPLDRIIYNMLIEDFSSSEISDYLGISYNRVRTTKKKLSDFFYKDYILDSFYKFVDSQWTKSLNKKVLISSLEELPFFLHKKNLFIKGLDITIKDNNALVFNIDGVKERPQRFCDITFDYFFTNVGNLLYKINNFKDFKYLKVTVGKKVSIEFVDSKNELNFYKYDKEMVYDSSHYIQC